MKKIVITTVLALAPFFTFAQNVFDQFNDVEGIETVSISGALFDMIGDIATKEAGKEADKIKDQIKNISSFKMYTTSEKKYRKEMSKVADAYIKSSNLEQLMSINNDGSKIRIYVRQEAGTELIKEGVVFIDDADDKELMLLAFTGSIDLKGITDKK